jgi:hypothetical protein
MRWSSGRVYFEGEDGFLRGYFPAVIGAKV